MQLHIEPALYRPAVLHAYPRGDQPTMACDPCQERLFCRIVSMSSAPTALLQSGHSIDRSPLPVNVSLAVAQWIVHMPPKRGIQVRFLSARPLTGPASLRWARLHCKVPCPCKKRRVSYPLRCKPLPLRMPIAPAAYMTMRNRNLHLCCSAPGVRQRLCVYSPPLLRSSPCLFDAMQYWRFSL